VRNLVLLAILLLEIGVFTAIEGGDRMAAGAAAHFWTYLGEIVVQSGPALLAAAGMTLILMTGGIDLSAGSTAALIACVLSSFEGGPDFWWRALPAGLGLAILLGSANGSLIAFFDIPPIIATLGTMILYRGLSFVILGDLEKAPFHDVPGYEALGGLACAGGLGLLVFGPGAWLFHRSRRRRELLMIGGNRIAARYAGIPVPRRILEVYAVAGIFAFAAAVLHTARNGSVTASALGGFELQVIVAVVLGGTRVEGGNGSLCGSLLGVLILSVLDEGLRGGALWGDRHLPFKISHLWHIFLGAVLLGGVWLGSRRG
jgi:ribose transport system permease protein